MLQKETKESKWNTGNKGKDKLSGLKGMNKVEPSYLTSYSTQSKWFSDIKHSLGYLNLHVWGSVKIFIFLTIILTLHLWEEKFWWKKCPTEML